MERVKRKCERRRESRKGTKSPGLWIYTSTGTSEWTWGPTWKSNADRRIKPAGAHSLLQFYNNFQTRLEIITEMQGRGLVEGISGKMCRGGWRICRERYCKYHGYPCHSHRCAVRETESDGHWAQTTSGKVPGMDSYRRDIPASRNQGSTLVPEEQGGKGIEEPQSQARSTGGPR